MNYRTIKTGLAIFALTAIAVSSVVQAGGGKGGGYGQSGGGGGNGKMTQQRSQIRDRSASASDSGRQGGQMAKNRTRTMTFSEDMAQRQGVRLSDRQ